MRSTVWTVGDAVEDFARILKPDIDLVAEGLAALMALPPAVAAGVATLEHYHSGRYWPVGERSSEPLPLHGETFATVSRASREPSRAFARPVPPTRRERQDARAAAVKAGKLRPPSAEILAAWVRAERARPGSTDPQLRAAAAWEKTALQRWHACDDAGAGAAFARAQAIIDEFEPQPFAA